MEIERFIAQLQSSSPSTSVSAALAGLPSLRQPSAVASPSRAGPATSYSNQIAGLPCNDRALLAQGASGSSVVINLEDVVSLWLGELEDDAGDAKSSRRSIQDSSAGPIRPSASSAGVKLEPTAASIPTSSSTHGGSVHLPVGILGTLHPPAPYEVFLPPPSAGPSALPQVTASLVSYLPAEPERSRYLKAFRETMLLHPSFNIPNFEQRIAAIFTWAEGGTVSLSTGPKSKAELARDIFFSKPGGKKDQGRAPGPPPGSRGPDDNAPKPTLSFFSAACAAFALGALVTRNEEPDRTDAAGGLSDPSSAPPPPPPPADATGTSATLFALSEQSLQLYEKTAAYDHDSVMAMILQVLFMLHEGQMSVAQNVFPLVGKMVNVARMMGLAIDPDEFPGTYNLFEAETRRRLWWDVFYYDLFVADCMGHPPLIADNTHTTRVPADVDEEKFTPSSTTLPIPESADSDTSSVYFGLKCR
ncbi:hypothetical protein C8Q73DRAFT_633805 [Cubamyces lactineus]|nr:hypothetical protein C8Q73DRAFT_633805 [Cubamyces lactineus]